MNELLFHDSGDRVHLLVFCVIFINFLVVEALVWDLLFAVCSYDTHHPCIVALRFLSPLTWLQAVLIELEGAAGVVSLVLGDTISTSNGIGGIFLFFSRIEVLDVFQLSFSFLLFVVVDDLFECWSDIEALADVHVFGHGARGGAYCSIFIGKLWVNAGAGRLMSLSSWLALILLLSFDVVHLFIEIWNQSSLQTSLTIKLLFIDY